MRGSTATNKRYLAEGRRIYAVGDIHGMLAPLQRLCGLIAQEEKRRGPAASTDIVFLGDYIDRGRESRQVIDYLIAEHAGKPNRVFIKGNHEAALLNFLADPERHGAWLKWGGVETIASYGIDTFAIAGKGNMLQDLAALLSDAVPREHMDFYRSLKLVHEVDEYVFVHAGLRPGVPLELQSEADLLTIREDFINADYQFEKRIVFGHTISKTPYHENSRISVDTGAYATGKLTCAVLEDNHVGFLSS